MKKTNTKSFWDKLKDSFSLKMNLTPSDLAKIIIRAVVAIVVIIVCFSFSADFFHDQLGVKDQKAEIIHIMSIINSFVFFGLLVVDTIWSQMTSKEKFGMMKHVFRLLKTLVFAGIVVLLKFIVFVALFHGDPFIWECLTLEIMEIVVFGLLMSLCHMQRG